MSQDQKPPNQLPTVIAVISVVISLASLFYAKSAYDREDRFSAVIASESDESFRQTIETSTVATLTLYNYSKHTQSIDVDVFSNNISVEPEGGNGSSNASFRLPLPKLVVAVNSTYEEKIKLHTLKSHPENAVVRIYVNGELFREFSWKFDKDKGVYRPF